MHRAGLISTSGGLVYHWRALRHRRRLWQRFRATLAGWLDGWRPPTRRLLLIGPSAGHTLDLRWLARFDRLCAIEPDPLARCWLARRTGRRLVFSSSDPLAEDPPLDSIAREFPDTAVLFCNLLGQLGPPGGGGWHPHLARALGAAHWASFHDVASTAREPREHWQPLAGEPQQLEQVLSHFWHGGRLEIVDHETFRLAGEAPAVYAMWSIDPRRHHLIEWVAHRPGD